MNIVEKAIMLKKANLMGKAIVGGGGLALGALGLHLYNRQNPGRLEAERRFINRITEEERVARIAAGHVPGDRLRERLNA